MGLLNLAAMLRGATRRAVLARLLELYLRRGIRPVEVIEAGLGDTSLTEDVLAGCFGKHKFMTLQDRLNPRGLICLTEDQAILNALCSGLGVPVHVHPRTRAALVEYRLPGWDELLRLARRCALLFEPLRTVGWDIGLTPRGPAVAEGNCWWDPVTFVVAGPQAPGVALHPMSASAALLWQ